MMHNAVQSLVQLIIAVIIAVVVVILYMLLGKSILHTTRYTYILKVIPYFVVIFDILV